MSLFAFDDTACQNLALKHGSPLFIYNRTVAMEGFQALRSVLPDRVRLAYAVKANPHHELLAIFASLGASFDCASGGELNRVAALGTGKRKVFYTGPGKKKWELELACSLGAKVQAESWEDLKTLNEVSSQPISVNLRVHPAFELEEGNRIIGGTGPSAFGVDEEALPELLEAAKGLKNVQIRGLHVFAASNERNAVKLLATHGKVLALAKRMHEEYGLPMDQIDMGGGLGVSYSDAQEPLDLAELGQGLRQLLDANVWFQGELILEPGRFLAARCGVYLSRVIRVKESRGTRFVILEGGVNHLLRPLLTGEAFPVKAVDKAMNSLRPATLAGPLCTSLDRLGDVMLPELAPGDLLAFGTVGAYGFTEAMAPFLSHPVPQEIWV